MFKRILLIWLLACSSITHAKLSLIKRLLQKPFSASFGIDINEQLVYAPCNPTIANLNTITLLPWPSDFDIDLNISSMTVSELAHAIDQNRLETQTYLSFARKNDQETKWLVTSGIESIAQDAPVFIYSRGYAGAEKPTKTKEKRQGLCSIPKRGGSIVVGSKWLEGGIINGPCVMFDYPDTRSYFDFGLTNDQKCLECIHANVKQKTPNIIFFGNCRGSKALLTYLSRTQPQEVSAVILDAPFLDLMQFTKEIGKNYARFVPFADKLAKKIITTWYPNYNEQTDLKITELRNIPVHIPIFIGHLKGDSLVADQMIQQIVQTLCDSGHDVYLLVIDDKTKAHSRLYQTKPFQQAVNSFLKKYGLPHDPILAQEGQNLLNKAYYTAEHITIWKKGFLHVAKV